MIVLPFLGVLVYLIAQHDGMAQRNLERAQAAKSDMDEYVRSIAGGQSAADQIAKAKDLYDKGAITQADYESLKAKALAAA